MFTRHFAWIFSLFLCTTAFSQVPDEPYAQSVPGEFVVKLRTDQPEQAIEALAADGGQIQWLSESRKVLLVRQPELDTMGLLAMQAALADHPAVEFVEPNFIYQADRFIQDPPNDPQIGDLWFLDHVSALDAWANQQESPNVVVAVLDTGVFFEHEDLHLNIWKNVDEIADNGIDDDGNGYVDDVRGFNFYSDSPDPGAELVPVDLMPQLCGVLLDPERKEFEMHGTHVAGTIGAIGNNLTGIAGVTWKVQIMPLKFLGGPCGTGTLANAIRGIEYARKNGARIINCSWGGGPESLILRDAILAANNAGVLVVCAAGNGGSDGVGDDNDAVPHYPSSYELPNVISVCASGFDDGLTSFSNFGATSVDLAAPGADILSSIPDGASTPANSAYGLASGTSMATPIVSGAAALLMARYASASHLDIKQTILATVDTVTHLGGKCQSGGRLNLARALNPVAAANPTMNAAMNNAHANAAIAALLDERQYALLLRNAPAQISRVTPGLDLIIDLDQQATPGMLAQFFIDDLEGITVVSHDENIVNLMLRNVKDREAILARLESLPIVTHAEVNAVYRKTQVIKKENGQ